MTLLQRLGEDRFRPMTRDEEQASKDRLLRAVAAGDEATEKRIREELIERNLRLIMYIGKPYTKKLEPDEVMAIGSLALTRAVQRWDPAKGHLYGWATRWITTALNRAVDADRTIRIPETVAHRAALVQRDIAAREAALGRELTEEERQEVAGDRPTFDQHPRVASSLETPVTEEGQTWADLLEDHAAEAPDEEATRRDQAHRIRAAMRELTPLEQKVVSARFGLDDTIMRTLADLGKEHGLSGEAMRRIEASALAKLRHPALATNLKAH